MCIHTACIYIYNHDPVPVVVSNVTLSPPSFGWWISQLIASPVVRETPACGICRKKDNCSYSYNDNSDYNSSANPNNIHFLGLGSDSRLACCPCLLPCFLHVNATPTMRSIHRRTITKHSNGSSTQIEALTRNGMSRGQLRRADQSHPRNLLSCFLDCMVGTRAWRR